jgi:8-oxo-dGTP pyrophosphatase MutT (NUDIX family)
LQQVPNWNKSAMDAIDQSVARPVPAASILLVRGAPLEVLMVRRGVDAIFSSALVFPGGVVDAHDASEDWLPHVTGAESLEAAERSFRIAACRELLEEADVLVCDIEGRKAGAERGTYFDRIRGAEARVPLGGVVPFAHWVTPEGAPKRFDTHFYLCRTPLDASAKADGREIVAAEWIKPQDVIARAERGERAIMFPTLLNLMRLAESTDVDSALAAAAMRAKFTVVPRIERRGAMRFVVIPEAAGYGVTERPFRD